MLKTFEICPQKYYLKYIKQISIPQSVSFFEKGKKIHALANYYLRGENIEKMEKTLTREEQGIWLALKDNKYFQKTYVKSEYSVSCKVGNFWIGGRLDALVKDDKFYYILDYKTGSIPKNPEYDFQTIVYLLCLNKKLGSNINFVYIDLKNNKNYLIERLTEYEEKILKICNTIEKYQNNNEIEQSEKCAFCEYKKICNKFML